MLLLWSLQTQFDDQEQQDLCPDGCQATPYHDDQEPHSPTTPTHYPHILHLYDQV